MTTKEKILELIKAQDIIRQIWAHTDKDTLFKGALSALDKYIGETIKGANLTLQKEQVIEKILEIQKDILRQI